MRAVRHARAGATPRARMDTSAPPAPPHPLAPPPPPPAQAHPLHLALAQTLAQPGGIMLASHFFPAASGAMPAQSQPLVPAPAVAAVPAMAVPPGTLVPGPIGAPHTFVDGTAYLPGLTKSGKRRRKHPVAEVKGQWTQEEDERLIRFPRRCHLARMHNGSCPKVAPA